MPKKKGDKKKLSPVDKEWIYQTFVVTDNKAETARRCNVSLGSVTNVIKEFSGQVPGKPQHPLTREDRAAAHAAQAERIRGTADMALESITAEDLDSGRIPRRDGEGKLLGYTYYGPSSVQKATTFGILKDKEAQQIQLEQKMLEDVQSGKLMLPAELKGMVDLAVRMIGEMKLMDGRFEQENKELLTDVREVIAEAVTVEQERPNVVSFDEFDNPE